jgi:Wzt C-terminal domain
MATVQGFCDRAMLLHAGEVRYLGEPEEAALRYYRLNFTGGEHHDHAEQADGSADINVRLVDVWLQDAHGARVENVEQGEPITFGIVVEARRELRAPVFQLHVLNDDAVWVFGFSQRLTDGAEGRVAAGQRVRITGAIENPLVPGRYFVECWVARDRDDGEPALHVLKLTDFYVFGTRPGAGSVVVDTDIEAVVEPEVAPAP